MKTRFNTYDIVCVVTELQKLIGMRVNNIYDIDNKTYLIRFQRNEEKQVLLLESGNRIHTTNFEWPKNVAPCGFSMKLRKHLKNKRVENISQLGTDRIVNLQFGTGEAAYHIILELYDRGNMILTDHEMVILYVLRPHTEGDKVKFAVREKYPQDRAREIYNLNKEEVLAILQKGKIGDQVKKVLVSSLEYGPSLIEHVLVKRGILNSAKIGKNFDITQDIDKVVDAVSEAYRIFQNAQKEASKGYITQKKEERPSSNISGETETFYSNQEFHPMLFEQHSSGPYVQFDTFCLAVDEFFSKLESQKLELKAVQQEREALKKLENVKKDHHQRLRALEEIQEVDKQKAELITRNQELVDKAILSVQMLLANQLSWEDINELVKEAASNGDPIASSINKLKLEVNHISLFLTDPYAEPTDSEASDQENENKIPSMEVDVDLALTAFANARRYYDQKRTAAKKQQKTIESQTKALKSAERKTKQTLKEVQTITNINKARKVYWFEKFYWFISSENYLIIAGRDQQQNELIVKRYMKSNDIYVHADIHGASSVVIKNTTGLDVPPKTLNEAGTMAICYSVAWDAKVVTNAYWVWGEQVSKTAPTGEYLTTGSFMIRGKKNFLPPAHLILGLSFLFRLEDSCIEKHTGERKVLIQESTTKEPESESGADEDVEVDILDESDEDGSKTDKNSESKESTSENTPEKEPEKTEIRSEENNEDIKKNDNDSSSDSEEDSKFPDTHIKIQHFGGTKQLITQPVIKEEEENDDQNESVIYLGDNKPVIVKPSSKKPKSRSVSESSYKDKSKHGNNENGNNTKQQTKRGQKSKLKKIKEKYRDQDEEERKLRMEILQSSGNHKETKKNKKGKDYHNKDVKKEPRQPRVPQVKDLNEVDDEEITVQASVDMIDALTGIPLEDDELLFAVPVIAPYNTLSNYKFKVKLTPGTAKRGKAAKTAVSMFLKDRSITAREKDLLKAVKDEQMARNLPGKVKLSAPKLQMLRK
ncbi:nuclear export mediator factor NEMF homolog Clbn isoform X1 [Rhynchophorus ferrugineus]|uniref:nuclear export mediator factor NEMF homolog Clbn isoform X1 n=1 Tax=Rhynchophorus ferrugineus TaxID=354439 RepID=UPI003FCE3844